MKRSNTSNRQEILRIRQDFLIADASAFVGNKKERTLYLEQLEKIKPDLTSFQKETLIGLLLGDASAVLDHEKGTARIKIQQSVKHKDWLKNIKQIFLEYTGNDKELSHPSAKRTDMVELQTLKCKAFYDFLNPIFYKNQSRKGIDEIQIKPYISAVCVAAWFCGDGSKADYTVNQGKGVTFHSQGFTEAENRSLAAVLQSELNLKCQAKEDGKKDNQWRIDVSGESYENFLTKVGPYIDKTFFKRVPSGRVEGSRFGSMIAAERDNLLGSAIQDLDYVVENY